MYSIHLAHTPATPSARPFDRQTPLVRRHGGRRLAIVDIENLIGGAVLHPSEVAWARRRLTEVCDLTETDQVVIGTSHIGLIHVGTEWTRQRYVVRSGPNGADRALLEVLDENLPAKYDEVILASGDGTFAEAAAALCAAGTQVHVVAVRNRLARRLRLAASQTTLLDQPYRTEALPASA